MSKRRKVVLVFLLLLAVPFLLPEPKIIPVLGASQKDWHQDTFWYEPWGSSGTHKGVDIFGKKGQSVISASYGFVFYTGYFSKGGHVALVLGPKWRVHYYAHLDSVEVSVGSMIGTATKIGTLGDSGNAKGKPPHLHYSLVSLIPFPWLIDGSTQGYKKAFYLDPTAYFSF